MIELEIGIEKQNLEQVSQSSCKFKLDKVSFSDLYQGDEPIPIKPGETKALLAISDNGRVTKYYGVIDKVLSYEISNDEKYVNLSAVFRFTEQSPFQNLAMIPYTIGPQIRIGSALGMWVYVDIDISQVYNFAKEHFSYCVTNRRGVRYKFDTVGIVNRYMEFQTDAGVPVGEWIANGIIVVLTSKDLPNKTDRERVMQYIIDNYINLKQNPGKYNITEA